MKIGPCLTISAVAEMEQHGLGVIPATAVDFIFANDTIDTRLAIGRNLATASRVDSTGNIVLAIAANTGRVDYDPVTFACRGLLVEPLRVNLCLQSANLSLAWTLTAASVTSPGQKAPDNTTAQQLVESAANSAHGASQSITYANATAYTMSVYAHANARSQVQLTLDSGATAFGAAQAATFDLAAVSAAVSAGNGAARITAAGGGWYRCSLTATSTAGGAGTTGAQIMKTGSASYAGDGASGLFVWGAQVEAANEESSYISTTTVSVTRNADKVSATGANFSAWFAGSVQGTFAADFSWLSAGLGGDTRAWQVDDGTQNNRVSAGVNNVTGAAQGALIISSASMGNASVVPQPHPIGSCRISTSFSAALGMRMSVNGGPALNSLPPQAMPAGIVALGIGGASNSNSNKGVMRLKRLRYWTQTFSDAALQTLST